MRSPRLWHLAAAVALAASAPGQAADPFEATIDNTSDPEPSHTFGFSDAESLFNSLDPQRFADLLQYVCNSSQERCDGVDAFVNFRGLGMDFQFLDGDGVLLFTLEEFGFENLGFGVGFVGTVEDQRRHAIEELKDFFKSEAFLKKLLTYMAQNTPYDPVAGNPDSLMTRAMFSAFTNGFTHKVSQVWACGTSAFNFTNDQPIQVAVVGGVSDIFADAQSRAAALQAQNEVGYGALVGNTTAPNPVGGADVTTMTLAIPLSYTIKLDSNPSHKVRIDLPLTYMDTEGATSYAAGFGLAYTYPVTDVWTLTPAAGVGATGSEDLGSAGGVSAYSITSAYTWRLGGFALSMGNSVGQYESLDITIGDYSAGPEISNTAFTNGFMLTGPNSLLARNLVVEYFVTDTRITGDTVYSDFYDEFGIALGVIDTEHGVIDSYYKAGLSYLIGDHDIRSIKLSLTGRF